MSSDAAAAAAARAAGGTALGGRALGSLLVVRGNWGRGPTIPTHAGEEKRLLYDHRRDRIVRGTKRRWQAVLGDSLKTTTQSN